MPVKLYQVDAFADRLFEGNPAAICILEQWPEDALMQAIARENNLSETAFLVATPRGYRLRWFSPAAEVDLCGHATLAAAFVLFQKKGYTKPSIVFETRSGDLIVRKSGEDMVMDFPVRRPVRCKPPAALTEALGRRPVEVLAADDYIAVYESEEEIRGLVPDLEKLSSLDLRGVAVTAPGKEFDFVSRFFGPKLGIPEDPVTGSAHCELAPYWQGRLNKIRFTARQLSRRGGSVGCEIRGDRVELRGRAVLYLEADITRLFEPPR